MIKLRAITAFNQTNKDWKSILRDAGFKSRTWRYSVWFAPVANNYCADIWLDTAGWTCASYDDFECLSRFKNTFRHLRTDLSTIKDAAQLLQSTSGLEGFQVGASFNMKPYSPFFPFSYGEDSGISIGLELCGWLCEQVRGHSRMPLNLLQQQIAKFLAARLAEIERMFPTDKLPFLGFDLSVAPYPYPIEQQSVAELFELIGNIGIARSVKPYRYGDPGTIAVNRWLTTTIKLAGKLAQVATVGFNGVMHSPLEDQLMGERMAQGVCSVATLQALSTTCGVGLDMIAIEQRGDRTTAIESWLLDTAALSAAMNNKPLGVRLLRVPGDPGDETLFEHEYIANTAIQRASRGIGWLGLPNQSQRINL